MRKIILHLLVALFLCMGNLQAQNFSSTQNYIRTRTMTNESGTTYLDRVHYFDGLARPMQVVQRAQTPSSADLVNYQEYDAYGRESNTWLPVNMASNNGAYVTLSTLKARSLTVYSNDANTYSRLVYEASPLNRVVQEFGPGQDWHTRGKAVSKGYLTNVGKSGNTLTPADSLVCALYIADDGTDIKIYRISNYDAGTLGVNRVKDEDGRTTYEFKDQLGRTVLIRQLANNLLHDTYYVYDNYGNLRAVLPPEASDRLITTGASSPWTDAHADMSQWAYLYKYDHRNRCSGKKLPGCRWTSYIYDMASQLIFSQDGEQYEKRVWSFYLYDALGRTCVTGICKDEQRTLSNPLPYVVTTTRNNSGTTYKGYTNPTNITLANPEVMTVNYYDDYTFIGYFGIDSGVATYDAQSGFDTRYTSSAKSLLTGTLTAKLDGSGTYLYAAMYYDNRSRLIQTKGNNHLSGGTEKEYIAYNFTNLPLQRKHVHSGYTTQTELYTYGYDHAGRLKTTQYSLNGATAVTLADNTYDELGRLLTNRKNNTASLQTSYGYNVRSWVKSISSSQFAQTLYYNDSSGSNTVQYNGNISAMQWTLPSQGRWYNFRYDNLSRLTSAAYTGMGSEQYGTSYTYDKHGNIKTLQRYGKTGASSYGLVDNLTLNHTGNQLLNVHNTSTTPVYGDGTAFNNGSNTTTEYEFDTNGNLTKDLNKNITGIQYNHLNLPSLVQFSGGSTTYLYTADGAKRKVTHTGGQSKSTDYCGSVIYENGSLARILVEGGYVTMSGSTPVYHFYLRDHLGNNRVVANAAGTTEQVTHYYPFGGLFSDGMSSTLQPYKYNDKELDRVNGLDWYDYEARMMDPVLGSFPTMDPLSEKYYSISPYAYCGNNPVNNVDFNGDSITIVHRTGFLGLGGKETLTYENGNLFNADGSAYTGKVKGYLKSAVGALGSLNATAEGSTLVSELQNSTNMFTIKSGDNAFVPNSPTRAGANLAEVQAATGNMAGSSGSGGTIYWNANSTNGGLDLAGNTSRPAYIGLGHEMGHASDSNQGLLHFSNDYTNVATGTTYFSSYNGLLKSEWRAVNRENIIRGQAGISLRTHYGINMSTGVPVGIGPRLLSPLNRPLNYH